MVKKLIIYASLFTILHVVGSESSQQLQKTLPREMSYNTEINQEEIDKVKETIEKLGNSIEKFRNSTCNSESNKKLILGLVGGIIIGGGVVGLAALCFLLNALTSR